MVFFSNKTVSTVQVSGIENCGFDGILRVGCCLQHVAAQCHWQKLYPYPLTSTITSASTLSPALSLLLSLSLTFFHLMFSTYALIQKKKNKQTNLEQTKENKPKSSSHVTLHFPQSHTTWPPSSRKWRELLTMRRTPAFVSRPPFRVSVFLLPLSWVSGPEYPTSGPWRVSF